MVSGIVATLEFPYQEEADRRMKLGLEQLIKNYTEHQNLEIHCITGPMRSCKSAVLLAMFEYLISKGVTEAIFFKSHLDTRDYGVIKSRSGNAQKAIIISSSNEIWDYLLLNKPTDVSKLSFLEGKYVFIDELQFLDAGIIEVLKDLRAVGVYVFVSFLNQDFRGKPFEFQVTEEFKLWEAEMVKKGLGNYVNKKNVGDVLAITASIVNMSAICPPRDHATMSAKRIADGEIIQAGDHNYFVCRPDQHPEFIKRRAKFE